MKIIKAKEVEFIKNAFFNYQNSTAKNPKEDQQAPKKNDL